MSKEYNKIVDGVKKTLKPDSSIYLIADKYVKILNNVLKDLKIEAVCSVGGSVAKRTNLSNDSDIDVFMRFNDSYKDEEISNICEQVLNKFVNNVSKTKISGQKNPIISKISRIHGSRDYFQFAIKEQCIIGKAKKILEFDFEIIPNILVHNYESARNITDLSPLHVLWVRKYLDKNPELENDIRLTKQFCKSIKVYGAESYINGFSGHIIDILIIKYGSFNRLIEEFSKKKLEDSINNEDNKVIPKLNPIIIDIENNMKDHLKTLNPSKIAPLIIIDPIQKDRNSSAALNFEKLNIFINKCKEYNQIKNVLAKKFSSKDKKLLLQFFKIEKWDLKKEITKSIKHIIMNKSDSKIKSKDLQVLKVQFKVLNQSRDISGTKMLKAIEHIVSELEHFDFKIYKFDFNMNFDKKIGEFYIITNKKELSKHIARIGPNANLKAHVENFKNTNKDTYIKNGRIYAKIKRKFVKPKDALTFLLNDEYTLSRVISGKLIK